MKKIACLTIRMEGLKVPNMVNGRFLMVNGANYYVNEIDLLKTYI